MIKNIVTNERLNKALQDLINNSKFYYPGAISFFRDMYVTGCRSRELLFPELTSYDSGFVRLISFKSGFVRSFTIADLSQTLIAQAQTGIKAYGGITSHQLMNEYQRWISLKNLSCGNKDVQLYSFRYNRARIEREAGKTDTEIMAFMGWQQKSVMNGYISNTLNERR